MNHRVHDLPGSFNVRDLGGLPTSDGRQVRTGRLVRSDYPGFAADPAAVRRLGLRTVVDLRFPAESDAECVVWEDHAVTYHQVPVVARDADSWHAGYSAFLVHRPDRVVEAVRILMESAHHPALFHCAAGKDRTGVIAALLLGALGVDRAEIVADYVLTAGSVEAVITRLRAFEPYATMLADATPESQQPTEDNIGNLLDHLDAAGGTEAWLLAHGLPAETLADYRAAMLD
ncbi:MAG TPA: tyrosine-protein phosphatase [Nocardioides sp.]